MSVPLRHLERLVAELLPWKVTLAVPMILSSEAGSPGPGVLRVDEGTSSAAWYVTAGAGGATEVREPMLSNFVKN